jgi:hypothetical protein
MTSATLSFVDERQVLTVIQSMFPLYECADHAPAESAIEPLHSIGDSAAVEPLHSITDPTAAKSTTEPLQSVDDLDAGDDASTHTSYS